MKIKTSILLIFFSPLFIYSQIIIEYATTDDIMLKLKKNENAVLYTTATWCYPCIKKISMIDSIVSLKKQYKLIMVFENKWTENLSEKTYLKNLNIDTVYVLDTLEYANRPKKNIKIFTKKMIKSEDYLNKIDNWILGTFILYKEGNFAYSLALYGEKEINEFLEFWREL